MYQPGRAVRGAGIAAGIATVVIVGYFVVASIGEQLVFFGEQLTEEQRERADLLTSLALLVAFLGTPFAVVFARACVRNVERHRSEDAATCAGLIALCCPAAFFVVWLLRRARAVRRAVGRVRDHVARGLRACPPARGHGRDAGGGSLAGPVSVGGPPAALTPP